MKVITKTGESFNPADLEEEMLFEEHFPDDKNGLFSLGNRRFFLAEVPSAMSSGTILHNGQEIPIAEATPEDFEEVDIRRALEWYGKVSSCSDCSTGDIDLVCKLAAEQLS
jgi:hypothetical protein